MKLKIAAFGLFAALISSPLFAEDTPTISSEQLIHRIVNRLIEAPDSETEEIVELCEILAQINGPYVKQIVELNLSRFESKEYFIKATLLPALHAEREATFDLEKLMAEPVFAKRLKPLLEQGSTDEASVVQLREFLAGSSKPKPVAGTLIIEFYYSLSHDSDDRAEINEEIEQKKLPGERGNLFTSFARKNYQQIFEEVISIIDTEMPGYTEDKKMKVETTAQERKYTRVKATITIPSFIDTSSTLAPKFKELVDEYDKYRDGKDLLRITVEYVPSVTSPQQQPSPIHETVENEIDDTSLPALIRKAMREDDQPEKGNLSELEKKVLPVLKSSSKWEEQWMALEELGDAPSLSRETQETLLTLFEETKAQEIKFKALSLVMMKNEETFLKIKESTLIDYLNTVTVQEFTEFIQPISKKDFFISSIKKIDDRQKKTILLEHFLKQNPNIAGQDIEVIRDAAILVGGNSSNHFDNIVYEALKNLAKTGHRADIVYLLPLLRANDQKIRTLAQAAIDEMRERK